MNPTRVVVAALVTFAAVSIVAEDSPAVQAAKRGLAARRKAGTSKVITNETLAKATKTLSTSSGAGEIPKVGESDAAAAQNPIPVVAPAPVEERNTDPYALVAASDPALPKPASNSTAPRVAQTPELPRGAQSATAPPVAQNSSSAPVATNSSEGPRPSQNGGQYRTPQP